MDLSIRTGEFFSLLGPSGCGKTTTLRMVAGFEHPTVGQIYVAGAPMAGVPPYKRPVNTVFQNYGLFPHLNVWENVAFGLKRKRVARSEVTRRVGEALEMVEMDKMMRRKPSELSGGQQQRVALARALVNQPTVLLLDEPLGALDAKLRKAMQLELKKLQSDAGITFIYVTHDQEEALTMSDRIAVMSQGIVEQVSSPAEIYENPQSAFVANFIGVSNIYPSEVKRVERDVVECVTSGGLRILVAHQAAGEVPVGARVGVVVRPEKITIRAEGDASAAVDRENVFQATIQGGRVRGFGHAVRRRHRREASGPGPPAEPSARASNDDWREGQAVRLPFWARSCSLITDAEGGLAEKDLMGEVVRRM